MAVITINGVTVPVQDNGWSSGTLRSVTAGGQAYYVDQYGNVIEPATGRPIGNIGGQQLSAPAAAATTLPAASPASEVPAGTGGWPTPPPNTPTPIPWDYRPPGWSPRPAAVTPGTGLPHFASATSQGYSRNVGVAVVLPDGRGAYLNRGGALTSSEGQNLGTVDSGVTASLWATEDARLRGFQQQAEASAAAQPAPSSAPAATVQAPTNTTTGGTRPNVPDDLDPDFEVMPTGGLDLARHYARTLPNPNKIVARQWVKMPTDTKSFLYGAYRAKGYSDNDVQSQIEATLPQFKAPGQGRVT